MTVTRHSWAVVVPVKRLGVAKTRLGLEADMRADLALAMALDTVRACTLAPSVAVVVVVTDDERATSALRVTGAVITADEPDSGLNPALGHGAAVAARLNPNAGIATIASDLPALRPDELEAVLAAAAGHAAAAVADAAGEGTTLLTADSLTTFAPAFGPQSRARHLATGAVDLTDQAGVSLRRDVDTSEDLLEAVALGCGPATSALMATRPWLVRPDDRGLRAPGS